MLSLNPDFKPPADYKYVCLYHKHELAVFHFAVQNLLTLECLQATHHPSQ
jgi:hypothetical protein